MASQMSPQVVQLVVWTKGEEMGEGEEEKMPDDDAGDAGELANEGLDLLCRLPQAVYVHVVASAGRAAQCKCKASSSSFTPPRPAAKRV